MAKYLQLIFFYTLIYCNQLTGNCPVCPAQNVTLEEAIAIALENNKQVLSLQELIQAAQQRRLQYLAEYLPSAEFTANYYKTEENFILNPQNVTSAIASITSIQQLATLKIPTQNKFYDSGFNFRQLVISKEIYHKIQRGKLEVIDVKLELKRVINDLIYLVRTAYYMIVLTTEEVVVQEENLKNLAEALTQEGIRLQQGKAATYDYNQSKVSYANALSDYYKAQKDLQFAKNNLIQLLGIISNDAPCCDISVADKELPILRICELSEKLKTLGFHLDNFQEKTVIGPGFNFISPPHLFTEDEIEEWQDLAFYYRPQIQKQENTINITNQNLKSRQSAYYPTLQAVASYRTQWFPAPQFSQQDYSWLWGVELRWNLFDGLGRERRIREYIHNEKSAIWDYWKSVEDAQIEVKNLFNEMEEELLSYYAANESRKLAILALNQAKDRLQAGLITPLQYRDSSAAYLKARHNFNASGYELLKSYYGLRRASGIDVCEDCCD